jgi:hypothetical protein
MTVDCTNTLHCRTSWKSSLCMMFRPTKQAQLTVGRERLETLMMVDFHAYCSRAVFGVALFDFISCAIQEYGGLCILKCQNYWRSDNMGQLGHEL